MSQYNALSLLHGKQIKTRRQLENSKKEWSADTMVAKKGSKGTEKTRDGPEVDTAEVKSREIQKKELPASNW